MCFAPQRRALFPHRNFQKSSEHGVFCHFLLPNVLRATTACIFSCLIWPATSAPAALASLPFDPRTHKTLEKHSVSRLSYLIAHLHLLSSDFLHLCSSPFWLSPRPSFFLAVPFPFLHIVGSLASKLPSIIILYHNCTILECIIFCSYYSVLNYVISWLNYITITVYYYTVILYHIILWCCMAYHIIFCFMILCYIIFYHIVI